MKEYYKAIRFMTTMLLSCILVIVGGLWIDSKIHTTPIIMLILLALTMVANFYLLLKGMKNDE